MRIISYSLLKNMVPLFVFITQFFSLTGCASSNPPIVEDTKKLTIITPEGHWSLVSIKVIESKQSVENYNQEIYEPDDKNIPVYMDENGVLKPNNDNYLSVPMEDLVFIGDSIAWLNYPLQMQKLRFYKIESGLLKIGNDNSQKSITLSSDQDTLRISYLDRYGLFLEETYKRTSFNDSILNVLTLYKINLPELAGTWELIRMESLDGGLEYHLRFPHKIPDRLVLTREELASTMFLDKSCQLLTDGKKQKYFINYKDGELLLTPDRWYNKYEWLNQGKYVDEYLRFRKVK
jgi:hypothetical protein